MEIVSPRQIVGKRKTK